MTFTVVVVTDEYHVECYGRFQTREAAEEWATARDDESYAEGHDGWTKLDVCQIQPLRDFAAA